MGNDPERAAPPTAGNFQWGENLTTMGETLIAMDTRGAGAKWTRG